MTGTPITEADIRGQHAEYERPKIKVLQDALDAIARSNRPVDLEHRTAHNTIRFGVIADTQFGSLYETVAEMQSTYRMFREEGIDTVLHAGDVLDGHGVYRGHEFELHKVGLDAQLAWFQEATADDEGLETFFITGNHDASYGARVGVDVGAALSARNPRWHCLGRDSGRIRLTTSDGRPYDVMLLHPGGGTAYALSYRVQKTIEQLEGGSKPQMIVLGHYHKAEYIPSYRNMAGLQAGCLQRQTPFMVRQSIAAHVGAWIIEVTPGRGADQLWNRTRAEFISFYRDEAGCDHEEATTC